MAMAQPDRGAMIDIGAHGEVSHHPAQSLKGHKAVTWRSVLLCLILLPVNAYWVVQMEVVRYSAHPTTISLFFNAIFILLCLTILNRGVRHIAPGLALERGELLLIYTVLAIGSCVCGHDMLQVFVPMLTWSFKHATASNGWD